MKLRPLSLLLASESVRIFAFVDELPRTRAYFVDELYRTSAHAALYEALADTVVLVQGYPAQKKQPLP